MTPLALTLGEPSGIGPDITLMAWKNFRHALPPFCVFGSLSTLKERAKQLGIIVQLQTVSDICESSTAFPQALPVLECETVVESIKLSVERVLSKQARAIITNPIAKSLLYKQGFTFPGHTEYLANLATEHEGRPIKPVMMIWSLDIAVIPITIHIPLKDVPSALSTEEIESTITIADHDLKTRFGKKSPRFKLCGLNPHAGENGTIGTEEKIILEPAIARLQKQGILITGPRPADTLFHEAARKTFDVAVGLYHDQVLTPIKALAFDNAVNVTLGLPFIRTSPDHGTAFDIVGTGQANPTSLIEAIKLADRLSQ